MTTIFEKIQAAQQNIKPVKKSLKDGLTYAYQTAEDVADAVKEVIDFAIVPIVIEAQTASFVSQNKKNYTKATVTIDFILSAAGCENITIRWIGESADFGTGDKAINKAITSATKQFCRTLFMIPSEDAPAVIIETSPTQKALKILVDYAEVLGYSEKETTACLYLYDVRSIHPEKIQKYKDVIARADAELVRFMTDTLTPEKKHKWFKLLDERPMATGDQLARDMFEKNEIDECLK